MGNLYSVDLTDDNLQNRDYMLQYAYSEEELPPGHDIVKFTVNTAPQLILNDTVLAWKHIGFWILSTDEDGKIVFSELFTDKPSDVSNFRWAYRRRFPCVFTDNNIVTDDPTVYWDFWIDPFPFSYENTKYNVEFLTLYLENKLHDNFEVDNNYTNIENWKDAVKSHLETVYIKKRRDLREKLESDNDVLKTRIEKTREKIPDLDLERKLTTKYAQLLPFGKSRFDRTTAEEVIVVESDRRDVLDLPTNFVMCSDRLDPNIDSFQYVPYPYMIEDTVNPFKDSIMQDKVSQWLLVGTMQYDTVIKGKMRFTYMTSESDFPSDDYYAYRYVYMRVVPVCMYINSIISNTSRDAIAISNLNNALSQTMVVRPYEQETSETLQLMIDGKYKNWAAKYTILCDEFHDGTVVIEQCENCVDEWLLHESIPHLLKIPVRQLYHQSLHQSLLDSNVMVEIDKKLKVVFDILDTLPDVCEEHHICSSLLENLKTRFQNQDQPTIKLRIPELQRLLSDLCGGIEDWCKSTLPSVLKDVIIDSDSPPSVVRTALLELHEAWHDFEKNHRKPGAVERVRKAYHNWHYFCGNNVLKLPWANEHTQILAALESLDHFVHRIERIGNDNWTHYRDLVRTWIRTILRTNAELHWKLYKVTKNPPPSSATYRLQEAFRCCWNRSNSPLSNPAPEPIVSNLEDALLALPDIPYDELEEVIKGLDCYRRAIPWSLLSEQEQIYVYGIPESMTRLLKELGNTITNIPKGNYTTESWKNLWRDDVNFEWDDFRPTVVHGKIASYLSRYRTLYHRLLTEWNTMSQPVEFESNPLQYETTETDRSGFGLNIIWESYRLWGIDVKISSSSVSTGSSTISAFAEYPYFWQANSSENEWVHVDLGLHQHRHVMEYRIECTNATHWLLKGSNNDDVFEILDENNDTETTTYPYRRLLLPSRSYRHYRLYIKKSAGTGEKVFVSGLRLSLKHPPPIHAIRELLSAGIPTLPVLQDWTLETKIDFHQLLSSSQGPTSKIIHYITTNGKIITYFDKKSFSDIYKEMLNEITLCSKLLERIKKNITFEYFDRLFYYDCFTLSTRNLVEEKTGVVSEKVDVSVVVNPLQPEKVVIDKVVEKNKAVHISNIVVSVLFLVVIMVMVMKQIFAKEPPPINDLTIHPPP